MEREGSRQPEKTIFNLLPTYLASYVAAKANTTNPIEAVARLCDMGEAVLAVDVLSLLVAPRAHVNQYTLFMLANPDYRVEDCQVITEDEGEGPAHYVVLSLEYGGERDAACIVLEKNLETGPMAPEYIARPCTASEFNEAMQRLGARREERPLF